jgi:malate dehydrogenase (oxaloacetate-decarboxylating)
VTAFLEDLAAVGSNEDRDVDPAFALHRGGKIDVGLTVPLETREDLSLAYTPGVARICSAIAEDPALAYDYTWKSRTVAIVTDGTAVLGLGDIGAVAGRPVRVG